MNRRRLLTAGGGVLVAAMLGVGVVGTAFADNPATPTGSQPATSQESRAQRFLDKLAANLGLSSDQLQNGLKTTEKQYVDQAAQNGKLTPEQATALEQQIDQSNGIAPLGRFLQQRFQQAKVNIGKAVADTLGITPQQLKSELQSGKTLKDVIVEHSPGKTPDQAVQDVVNAVVAQAKTRLDTAVQNGKLSSEQETTILNNLSQRLTNRINNPLRPGVQPAPNATPGA